MFIAYYLVLSFLLMYSSSGLCTDVFPNKTNINTYLEDLHTGGSPAHILKTLRNAVVGDFNGA